MAGQENTEAAERDAFSVIGVTPDEIVDGGDLDCGSGLLLIIRKAMNRLQEGQVLEIDSTEISVREDLPAWCRLTGNPLVRMSHPEYHIRRKGG